MMKHYIHSGFTLFELMIALAIAAILLAVAVPNFQIFFDRNRIAAVSNDFMGTVNYARSEAVKGGATTYLCMSSDGLTCTGNSGWIHGWIVWSDRNGNQVMDAGERLQSHLPNNTGQVAMGGTQTDFAFNGLGALTSATLGNTFNICLASDLAVSKTVTIEQSGHLRLVSNPSLVNCP